MREERVKRGRANTTPKKKKKREEPIPLPTWIV
jgi:hypothetical protein